MGMIDQAHYNIVNEPTKGDTCRFHPPRRLVLPAWQLIKRLLLWILATVNKEENHMKRSIPLLAILPVMFLVACNLTGSVTENANPATPANLPTTEIASATPTDPPTTEVASPTPTNLPATDTPAPQPELPIVYYYFVAIESNTFPCGKCGDFS